MSETKTVMMPRSLTAENGAKTAFMGEFKEQITLECPDCMGLGEETDYCGICHGSSEFLQDVPVSWTTIKAIYAKAVKELGS